jgi:hypothetical protein
VSILRGMFFKCAPFVDIINSVSDAELANIITTFLRPRAASGIGKPPDDQDDTIGLHFRSGDIFSKYPHPGYVQPPLSYYQACLEHHLNHFPAAKVILMFECEANPCVQAMARSLERLGISYSIQSSDLLSDLARLFGLRTVAWGVGTFGAAVTYLSSNIRRCYCFENGLRSRTSLKLKQVCRVLDIDVIRVFNGGAGYIAPAGWKNTSEQRELLLNYPRSKLLVEGVERTS